MKTVKSFLLLVLVSLLSVSVNASISDHLKPSKIKGKLKDEFSKLDVKAKLKFLDVDVIDGINFSAKYIYEVEPSYKDGLYSRIDKWDLSMGVSPGDILGLDTAPIYLNIKKGSSLTFVRQFNNQIDALKAKPLTPEKLPLTAKKALKLDPGTFVAIPTSLNIAMGANAGFSNGMLNAGLGFSYIVSGDFIIHVFRLNDNKVRLKLIAVNKKSRGISGSAGFSPPSVIGISIIDKKINKVIDTNLFQIGMAKTKGELFVIDYLLDLNIDSVRKAYNHILGSTFKLKRAEQLRNFIASQKDGEALITNLDEIESLFAKEKTKNPEDRFVDRKFKGTNVFSQKSKNLKIGMNLIKFGKKKDYTENFLTYENENNNKQFMIYNVNSITTGNSWVFGLYEEEKINRTYMLLKAKEDGSIVENGLSDYGFTYDMKDKFFREGDQAGVKERLIVNLPTHISDQIDWTKFTTKKAQDNAKVYYQYLFDKKVISILRDTSKDELIKKFYSYLKSLEERGIKTHITKGRVKKISGVLATALSSKVDKVTRRQKVTSYLKMNKYKAFRRYGIGFLQSLLTPAQVKNLLYFKMTWSSKKEKTRNFEFGNNPRSNLFKTMEFIQNLINNRSFDLRLVGFDPDKAANLESQ